MVVIHLAIISSIPHLRDLSSMGTMEMALAPMVLQHPAYAAYYAEKGAEGKWVILDNGAFEMDGEGLTAEQIHEAAERIRATEIVCRDVVFDGERTIRETKNFIGFLYSQQGGDTYGLMGVPQGKTIVEWMNCYEKMLAIREITSIGLSKLSVPAAWKLPLAQARLQCVNYLYKEGLNLLPLHLLGGGPGLPLELTLQREVPEVRSNDSSFAFWYTKKGIGIDFMNFRAFHEVKDKPELVGTELAKGSILYAKKLVKYLGYCAGSEL